MTIKLDPDHHRRSNDDQAYLKESQSASQDAKDSSEVTNTPKQKVSNGLLVWIISDVQGLRQHVFLRYGCKVISVWFDLHSKQQLSNLINSLESERPFLVWIRLHGPCMGSGNRRDAARSLNMSQLIARQNALGGRVVLEANIRSQAWNMQAFRPLVETFMCSLHRACRYHKQRPCHMMTQTLSNFEIVSRADCNCLQSVDHVPWKSLRGEVQTEVMQDVLFDLAAQSLGVPAILGRDISRQPESTITPSTQDRVAPLQSNPISVRMSALHSEQDIANRPHNPNISDVVSNRKPILRHSPSKLVFRGNVRHADEHPEVFETDQTKQCAIYPTLSNAEFSVKTSQPSVRNPELNFPTEEAERQKEMKKAGHVPTRRKIPYELHHDDCGECLSSLDQDEVAAHFKDVAFARAERQQANFEAGVFAFMCHSHSSWLRNRPSQTCSKLVSIQTLNAFMSSMASMGPSIDVVELFGGDGKTTKILARKYNLSTGESFDAVAGFDLTSKQDVQYMWKYLEKHKPLVIIMAPPCGGFGPWARLNRIIYPNAHSDTLHTGLLLARLCAKVADFQLKSGRHFVIEQPRGSEMYQLPEWKSLLRHAHSCNFDQCRVGLKEHKPPFLPLNKPTEMWSSHPTMLRYLQGLKCDGQHAKHGKVTMHAQVWPLGLCSRLARGISEALIEDASIHYFPTFTCPGCRGHLRKSDHRHVRDSTCKFADEESLTWDCPGCKANRPRSHTTHTFGPDCQWAIAESRSTGSRRPRQGHHARDPVVPASSEPTGSLRVDGSTIFDIPFNPLRDVAASSAAAPPGVPAPETPVPETPAPETPVPRIPAPGSPLPVIPAPGTPSTRPRRRVNAATQADDRAGVVAVPGASVNPETEPPWTKHDLGAALQQLRSIRPGIVRRALRRLHIRWYHASASRMKMLLSAAGVDPSTLEIIEEIVNTCSICRMWVRPGPRSIASTSLATKFNESVQYDLLFHKRFIILHMLDACIRWSAAMTIPSKHAEVILESMDKLWFRVFGSPQELVGDRESGVAIPEESARFLECRRIKLTLRAANQHAHLIERHNDILRHQILKCDEQATADGLRVSFEQILSESVHAKNVLFVCGGYTPYEALYGRTPALLNTLDVEGDFGEPEDVFRLRSIAISSMVEATALAKAQRADRSKTRVSGELLELAPGDLVEFFRPPTTKDQTGWMGPAVVADVTPIPQGIVAVRWQGRTLDCRIQDIRRALVYHTLMFHVDSESPIAILRLATERCNGSSVRFG